jgi:MoaA/NifB/PqqE/SkfB family radical SAM enzyme
MRFANNFGRVKEAMLKAISTIPSYYLFRSTGRPKRLPMNLTFSVTNRCNSRCKTCHIYQKKSEELGLDEWKRVFESLGKAPFWTTFSGGEPFLRSDFFELVRSLYEHCRPSIINIPTNGLLSDRIPVVVKQITDYCQRTQIIVNVSLDGVGEKHDAIRGVAGNYEKALLTFQALKRLNAPNLSVGIHTVISKFNVKQIPDICKSIMSLRPDSYVTEIAEERVELDNLGFDITPELGEYDAAVDFLTRTLKKDRFNRVGRVTRALRLEYYALVKRILKEKRQVIPCYAGFASAQIAPDGDVWMCCVKAEPIGNLREAGYDFSKIWFSERANMTRRSIKRGDCYCPLANASYTSMLHHLPTLSRAGWNLVKMSH